MLNQREATGIGIWTVLAKLAVLFGLFVWVFWPEMVNIVSKAPGSSETVHALVTPLAIVLLVYCRAAAFTKKPIKGSPWGIVPLLAGLVLYAGTTWPFSYGYIRNAAMVPVLAGVVLTVCGRRILKLSLPMLLLVLLSLPISGHLYALLIIRPETYTIGATAKALDKLPGVDISVEGVDLFFSSAKRSGVIGLGESNRGARLIPVFAAVGVFIVFSRIRPLWRIIFAAAAAVPIVLFCNFFRFFCWGLAVIYTHTGPLSSMPRNVSAVFSLSATYVLFVIVSAVRVKLFIEDSEQEGNVDIREVANAQG